MRIIVNAAGFHRNVLVKICVKFPNFDHFSIPFQYRYSLSDQRRDGTSITLSPDERLAATTDEFGRVMLISTKQGIVLRTWKGSSVLLFMCYFLSPIFNITVLVYLILTTIS